MNKKRETSRVATSKQRKRITPSTKKKNITIAEGFRTFIKTKETENKSQTTINAYHDTIKNFYFFIGPETLTLLVFYLLVIYNCTVKNVWWW